MAGVVQAICISRNKGETKDPVREARLRSGHGIEGDAHAGPWHRQVSLLAAESIDKIRRMIPDLADGAFAENVVTAGIELVTLPIGSRLALGDEVVLEVTQIGKECHNGCAIRELTGDCVMPREGIFCRVITGGLLRPGDAARVLASTATAAESARPFPQTESGHA